jgi:hypothetical protein
MTGGSSISRTAPTNRRWPAGCRDGSDCGLYSVEDKRPVNELRMKARWKLGGALAITPRKPGARRDLATSSTIETRLSYEDLLEELRLNREVALKAQRIATLPDTELLKAFAAARAEGRLLHYAELIVRARPWWYKANRQARHRAIHDGARQRLVLAHPGPFPLIYADPPWRFEIYSEKGAERTPDQHYRCLST